VKTLIAVMLLLCLISLAAAAEKPSFWKAERAWLPTYVALQGWDAAVTQRGFSNCTAWHESNPVMPSSTGPRAAYFAGTAGAVIGASWVLHRAGHRKLSRAVLIGASAVEFQAATRTTVNGGRCR
jgi:hypothetical protein